MNNRSCRLIALGVSLVHGAGFAAVVFSNFGPGDGYDPSSGAAINWVVESPGSSGNMGLGHAARFQVLGGNYALSSVTLALGNIYSGGTNNLAISLREDQAGQPTGTLLETVVSRPSNVTADYLVLAYPSSLEPVMGAGNHYWLVVEPATLNLANSSDNAAFGWYWSGLQGPGGYREFDFAARAWLPWQVSATSLAPAFRIEGTLVPEPGPLWLLLGGGLGWWMLRSRSRRA